MTVRRTLPARGRSLIGAWCFVDHYGPDDVAETGGMVVTAHPHTGLQTASWLFTGEIEHRDSAGHHAMVRPGALDLMTAGHGISHSETSTAQTTTLHGVQLWIALPDHARDTAPTFEHHEPEPVDGPGWQARVFLGSALGTTSPVRTHTPLLGIELVLEPHAMLELDVDPTYELGVLVDHGTPTVADVAPAAHDLVHVTPGSNRLQVSTDDGPARVLVLGGPPFGEEIVMWWNFVGRSHEEVVGFREQWQAQVDGERLLEGRYGRPVGDDRPPVPAPVMPHARLRTRR
jgi:redox-sensitive bicupin YhaK (pirin superfamily)